MLFANIGFYGYLAIHEPSQLPVLETICELTATAGPDPWPIRDLNDMGDSLAEGPLNYVWFELLLILVAKRVWEAGAVGAFTRFRDTLRHPALTDDQILDRLAAIHPGIADAIRAWPR